MTDLETLKRAVRRQAFTSKQSIDGNAERIKQSLAPIMVHPLEGVKIGNIICLMCKGTVDVCELHTEVLLTGGEYLMPGVENGLAHLEYGNAVYGAVMKRIGNPLQRFPDASLISLIQSLELIQQRLCIHFHNSLHKYIYEDTDKQGDTSLNAITRRIPIMHDSSL